MTELTGDKLLLQKHQGIPEQLKFLGISSHGVQQLIPDNNI